MLVYKSYLVVFGITLLLNWNKTEAKVENECEKTSDADLTSLDCSIRTDNHGAPIQEKLQDNNKCDDDSWCWNGGTCSNNACKCLAGTYGPFCENIEGCATVEGQKRTCGNPDNVYCVYNVTSQKNYCRCADIDFVYDVDNKECKKCECVIFGKCSFVDGKKHCVCTDGYGLFYRNNEQDGCEYCGCGIFSDGCTFYGYANKVCNCKPGFAQQLSSCTECNCGPNGNCTFDPLFKKQCSCEPGYREKNGECQPCDCGSYGVGYWKEDDGEKMCDCDPGYDIENGKCVECGCFLGDKTPIGCTFSNGAKKCSCPEGYEDRNSSVCTDINECLNETACPLYSDCRNTPGSYECTCKSGYRQSRDYLNTTVSPESEEQPELDPKVVGCEDINECVEYGVCARNETTTCINLPGNYDCVCKQGFTLPPNEKTAENGCNKDESSKANVLYIVFGVLFGVIIVGGIAFFLIRKHRR